MKKSIAALNELFENLDQAVSPNSAPDVQKVHLYSAYNMYRNDVFGQLDILNQSSSTVGVSHSIPNILSQIDKII